jgi:tetratricopeptide (TPR) repeat protein
MLPSRGQMAKGRKQRRQRPAGRGPGATSHERQSATLNRAAIYWALAIAICAVIVYLNATVNDFVLDDIRLVRDNLRIRSLASVPHLFASSYWDLTGPQGLYRPLVLATYAVNYAIHGLSHYGYTAVNIALHVGVSVLLFVLVRGLGGSLFAAGVTGMAFAVHPVHAEAVAGISGRPDLLSAFFFLLALLFHRAAPGADRAAIGYRAAALASFACALLSKESAMTLVLVLPVMDAVVPARASHGQLAALRGRIVTDYLPFMVVALAYLAVRRAVLGGIVIAGGVISPLDNPLVPITTMPLGERLGATMGQALMTPFAAIVEYARLLFWPLRLSPDYSYNQIPLVTSAFDGRFVAGVALVAACVYGIVALRHRSPIAAFGLAFAALTFSIVSNFVVTIGTLCAERLMYLPSAGVLMAAGVGAERLAGTVPARRRVAYVVLILLIIVGGARTWARNRDWRTESALWTSAIAAAPGSARVQSEYGRLLMGLAENDARGGRTAEAERLYDSAQAHFQAAVNIYPSYSLPMDGLAMILSLHDRFDEALVLYERALKAWPGNYASLTNWGAALRERATRTKARASALRVEGKGREADELDRQAGADIGKAVERIDLAIAMMPSYPHAHLVRALLCDGDLADPAGAVAEFEEVLRLMPNHPQRALIENELARLKAHPETGTPAR